MLHFKPHRKRVAALLLSAAMLLGSVHLTPPAAAGTEWVQESVDKLTSWGVITPSDGSAQRLNARLTRAEFTAMINRAYGYTETTETPFTDVPAYAWYADDISIGYNAGYFSGTTETTASPNNQLTREQAITLLGRNMRLPETTGEVTQFTDGRSFSNWSKGFIKTAVDSGIVNGYEDGTFRPQSNITRAEMVKLLADSLGTLVNTSGVHTLGGVFGNLTLNKAGTTLRNTTIAGDLYLTGGIGLGNVTLENVNVMGRIIVAGGGESEGGDSSIVLRNVTAQSMLVDSLNGQYVSLSAQNDTVIPTTTVRTNAYIEDNSGTGMGLLNITLDGDVSADEDGDPEQMRFTIAGNIKSATNRTPGSRLTVGRGTVQNLTIDEAAVDSQLIIDADGMVENLNLDTGIQVRGDGDIGTLTVSAAGVRTTMLPDEIIIRPGLTANIAGEVMDPKLAEESSSAPRLLAGYPKANDIAPTSVLGVYSGNKSGTVYYAITPEVYGPVTDAEILVNPPTYGPTYTARGNVRLAASNTEASTRVGGLTVDGTYYLSAVLVDSRGDRSNVKNVKFQTPDNTVPNFATGYPYLSDITETDAQLTAMVTKTCQMYYAIFPRGSAAPTGNNFLANSLEGSVVSGVFNMTKNTPITEWTARDLLGDPDDPSAQVEYDMYLWLHDFDGGLSSGVRLLQFSTADLTPPEFETLPYVTDEQARSVTLTGTLDEDGTVYWVAVPEGEPYPKEPRDPTIDTGAHAVTVIGGQGGGTYEAGDRVIIIPETVTENEFRNWVLDPALNYTELEETTGSGTFVPGTISFTMPDQAVLATAYFVPPGTADPENASPIRGTTVTTGTGVSLHSDYARLQVSNGLNALRSGRVNVRQLTNFTFTVPNLEPQKRYDVYYVAMDTAGNYSDPVRMVQINTLDTAAPTVTQEFTRFPDGETVSTTRPYADTNIRLIFSEEVRGTNSTKSFLELYNDVLNAQHDAQALRTAKDTLGSVLASSIQLYTAGTGSTLPSLVTDSATIDYGNAIVQKDEDGRLVVLLASDGGANSALHLKSGTTYFFRIKDITDTSTAQNRMGQTDLPRFTTLSAEVFLAQSDLEFFEFNGSTIESDIAFTLTPMSTSTMDNSTAWDMILRLNTSAAFDLYKQDPSTGEWSLVGNDINIRTDGTTFDGISAGNSGYNVSTDTGYDTSTGRYFPNLKNTLLEDTQYTFAVHFTRIGSLEEDERDSWSQRVTLWVSIVAGASVHLGNLGGNINTSYDELIAAANIIDVGTPDNFQPYKQFTDKAAPVFAGGHPIFGDDDGVGDTYVTINLQLNRTGTVYYVVAPVGDIVTQFRDETDLDANGNPRVKSVAERNPNYDSTQPTDELSNNMWSYNVNVPQRGGTGDLIVSSPIQDSIVDPRQYGSESIKKGSTTVTTSTTRFTLTDLKADTDYFAYFVIRGEGQALRGVYLYKFHTERIVRPILTLSLSNPIVTMTSNRTADVNYILVANNPSSLPSVLTDPFSRYVADSSAYQAYVDQHPELASANVLTAMNTDVLQNYRSAGSLFDLYASDSLKDTMTTYITSQTGGSANVVGVGNTTDMPANTGVPVNCETAPGFNMSDVTQYIFLAAARSPQGSSYAFRAVYYVSKVDTEYPIVTSLGNGLNVLSNGRITGTLQVNFSEPIYRIVYNGGERSRQAIDAGPRTGVNRRSDFISIVDVATWSDGITPRTSTSNINNLTRQFIFDVSTNAQYSNFYITFGDDLCDSNMNVRPANISTLQVDIRRTGTAATGYGVEVSINNASWYPSGR